MSRSSQKTLISGFGLALAVLILNGLVSVWNIRELVFNDRRVLHSREVLGAKEEVLSTVREAEVAQRGYIITGREESISR